MTQPSICMLFAYFGPFPPWFPFFFDSLRRNATLDFIFFTDQDTYAYQAPNVFFHEMCFEEYHHLVRHRTGLSFYPKTCHKLCDLRPLFGWVHHQEIQKYDFYGYADIDLIFGDIRSFYTAKLLKSYDVFSTHEHILSGHFALFRNTHVNRFIFQHLGGWDQKLMAEEMVGMDEMLLIAYQKWAQVVYPGLSFWRKLRLKQGLPRLYLKEQFTTPFTPIPWTDGTTHCDQPDTWFYKNGEITNSRDGNRTFLYLHFMNFKSSKYRHNGSAAPWVGKLDTCLPTGFIGHTSARIDNNGITPIPHEWFLPCGP
jgi:hypothetical protein